MSKGFEGTPTPGPWVLWGKAEPSQAIAGPNGFVASTVGGNDIANAHLIAEAGTVLYETGLTPRQLAEQRAELLEALQLFVAHADEIDLGGGDAVATTCESLQSARAAIANATQQRNATGGEG